MAKKIPTDAFDFYFSLGLKRSYQAVAEKYQVSKRAVTAIAKRERWQERLEKVESEARNISDKKKVETLDVAKEQHLQALRLVLGKGIEGLRRMAITSPMDAVRAIGIAVREIRVEIGEPSDRTAVSIEDTIKREYERWLIKVEPDKVEPEAKDAEEHEDESESDATAEEENETDNSGA